MTLVSISILIVSGESPSSSSSKTRVASPCRGPNTACSSHSSIVIISQTSRNPSIASTCWVRYDICRAERIQHDSRQDTHRCEETELLQRQTEDTGLNIAYNNTTIAGQPTRLGTATANNRKVTGGNTDANHRSGDTIRKGYFEWIFQ